MILREYMAAVIGRAVAPMIFCGVACLACSSAGGTDEVVVQQRAALSPGQVRVLGFESPVADWSSPTGTLSQSSTHSQGSASLAVRNSGWTEISSVPLSSLGTVGGILNYDIRIPASVSWGETRAQVNIPSKGIYWQDIGGLSLVGMAPGTFKTATFQIPTSVLTALNGSYTDLRLRIIINGPTNSNPYLLDNIVFTTAPGAPGTVSSFSITIPEGVAPPDAFMTSTERLQVDDQVVLGTQQKLEAIGNIGTAGFELGSLAVANANVYNQAGAAYLRSQSSIRGFLRTTGAVTTQPPVTVTGGTFPNSVVNSSTVTWQVPWPASVQPAISLDADQPPVAQPPLAVAPGSYAGFNLQPRARAALTAGTYFFDSFNTEPEAKVFIDTSSGPIFIYTRTQFRFHGPMVQSAGPEGQLLVGYLGVPNVDLEAGFVGTMVAPNAQIDIRRASVGQHRGAFFGKRIEVFSSGTILHVPFSWDFLDADKDCDGMTDALEQLYGLNPSNPADRLSDSDGDGIPAFEELRAGGNPTLADTNGNGIGDDPDLLAGRDLDGDGVTTPADRCPNDTNVSQSDADMDGVGDQCDSVPLGGGFEYPRVTIQVARHYATKRYGALDAGSSDTSRQLRDQNGLVPTGTSFRLVREQFSGSNAITELFNSATGAHAYAITAADAAALAANGFVNLGTLGYASQTALTFGQAATIRHFVKGSASQRQDAITADSSEAASLVAAGFTETANFGFGLADFGKLRKPKHVVRYRTPSGLEFHSANGNAEVSIGTYASDGTVFGVLPERNGFAAPLYRLRSADGHEVLSARTAEFSALQSQGYQLDGVIGFLYPALGSVDTVEKLAPLYRLKNGSVYAHSVDATEIAQLKASGYADDIVVGRVVRSPNALLNPSQCVGQRNPLDTIVGRIDPSADPVLRNVAALYAFNSACTVQRVANGQVTSPEEQTVLKLWNQANPESRRLLVENAARLLAVGSAERLAALGPLATLDPGTCAQPVNYTETRESVGTVTQGLGISPDVPNGGSSGGGQPASYARLRAPQCQGVTYDPALAATPGAAARAITARDPHDVSVQNGEFTITTRVGEVYPRLYGVKREPPASPIDDVNAYACGHPNVQLPLIGIDVGDCTSACVQSAGEMCVNDRCRAYPIVPKGSAAQFTGSNLWDIKTAQVILTDFQTGLIAAQLPADVNVPPPQGESPTLRCEPAPVVYDAALHIDADALPSPRPANCPDPTASTSTPTPCPLQNGVCPPGCVTTGAGCVQLVIDSGGDGPTTFEPYLEWAQANVNVDSGKFYRVQVVNHNGSYFRFGDDVAITSDQIVSKGRTVHLCAPPACEPPADPTSASCTLSQAPNCGGSIGGIWNTPPRPLEYCRSLDPFTSQCPETPLTFPSSQTVDGLPLLVFVGDPTVTKFVQSRIIGLQCFDETGWDALGDDELVVHFASNPSAGATEDESIANIESAFGTFTTDINSDDTRRDQIILGSTAAHLLDPTKHPFLIEMGEDDDVDFWQIVIGGVAAVGAGIATAYSGGAALAILVASGTAGGTTFASMAFAEAPDPDDFLGRAAYQASTGDILNRAQQSHDGVLGDIASLELIPGSSEVSNLNVSQHPAVDLTVYSSNSQLAAVSCASDAACTGGKVCRAGVCVPSNWVDRSLPLRFNSVTDLAGTIEWRDYNGSGAHYRLYMSTSISGTDQKQ